MVVTLVLTLLFEQLDLHTSEHFGQPPCSISILFPFIGVSVVVGQDRKVIAVKKVSKGKKVIADRKDLRDVMASKAFKGSKVIEAPADRRVTAVFAVTKGFVGIKVSVVIKVTKVKKVTSGTKVIKVIKGSKVIKVIRVILDWLDRPVHGGQLDLKVNKVIPGLLDQKDLNGLTQIVELECPQGSLKDSWFVFISRNKKQVKLLYWRGSGLCLWQYRLEKQRFEIPSLRSSMQYGISWRNLRRFLDGYNIFEGSAHEQIKPKRFS